MLKTCTYTVGHPIRLERPMPAQQLERLRGFGARLATLRRAAGYTQQELADTLGVTQRMISYYEGQPEPPPSALLPGLAKALKVTTDELLGITPVKKKGRQPDNRLLRRLQQIEKLEPREKRQVMQLLDTFIEREQLKRRTG